MFSPLRRRMIEDMTVDNLSTTTQASYIHNVKKFSQYFGQSPDRLGLEDVRAYQVYLVSRGVAWATLNQGCRRCVFSSASPWHARTCPSVSPMRAGPKRFLWC
jgi:Phage integrase, N-terminal SAM-like domain